MTNLREKLTGVQVADTKNSMLSSQEEKGVETTTGTGAYLVHAERVQKSHDDLHVRADGSSDDLILKKAKDGLTVLIPQPSDDPTDPLNWSWSKKHLVLLSLAMGALLTDWGMIWGTTLFQAQAATWHMSVADVSNSVSGGIFLQGPGGLLAVPLTQRYGRLPVLFWSQFLACMMVIGAALAPTYGGFTALRTLQGLFNTAPQVIGLSIIHDMFFFHERTRKINLWAFSFLVGPYLGPFISAFIVQKLSWRACYGVLAGFYGLSTIMAFMFGDETLYNRKDAGLQQIGTTATGLSRKLQLVSGIAGARATNRPSPWAVVVHLVSIGFQPHLFLVSAGFIMIVTMWTIGIITTITPIIYAPPYLFTPTDVALLYLAPMIGVILGELWGHFFNDWLCNRYLRTHDGIYVPENRLWTCWITAALDISALIIFGQVLLHGLSWAGLAVSWAMVSFATLASTVAVSAYALDSFPMHAALAGAVINFWRTTGGFCVVYFQFKWIAHNGAGVTFGVQAAIVAAAFMCIIAVQIWGRTWRQKYPPPPAEN